jgi:DNA-directed RNA polymerase specialized sigma54-like protein
MRTQQEIKTEIEALKALKPTGRFANKTAESIALQIEELEYGVDQTADEWEELTYEQQSVVNDTIKWKEGHTKNPPSKEWHGLIS